MSEMPQVNNAPQAARRGGVIGWMSRHPVWLAIICLLLILAIGVFAFDRNAENRYQKKIREIRARGEPTTAAELVAATPGLPDEENQFLRAMVLAQSIKAIKLDDERLGLLPYVGTARFVITGMKLPTEQSAAIRSYLEECRKPLVELHETLSTGHGQYRPTFTTPMINTLLPELSDSRALSKVLALCVMDAADRGDSKTATDYLVDMYRFNEMWDGKRSMLIGALVKIALIGITMDQTERTINANVMTDESLVTIAHQVDAINLREMMRDAYITERTMMIDTMEWIRNNPGSITSFSPTPTGIRFIPGLPALNGVELLQMYEEFIAAVDGPTGSAVKRIDAINASKLTLPWYQVITKLLGPSASLAVQCWVRCEGQRRAMLVTIACERFRLKRGAWPEALDELVPEFLDAVPLDPFDEKPIRYARIPEGIKVWSIGEDFVDNGGDIRRLDLDPKKSPTDWGWVILDPPLRNRPAESSPTTKPTGP